MTIEKDKVIGLATAVVAELRALLDIHARDVAVLGAGGLLTYAKDTDSVDGYVLSRYRTGIRIRAKVAAKELGVACEEATTVQALQALADALEEALVTAELARPTPATAPAVDAPA